VQVQFRHLANEYEIKLQNIRLLVLIRQFITLCCRHSGRFRHAHHIRSNKTHKKRVAAGQSIYGVYCGMSVGQRMSCFRF